MQEEDEPPYLACRADASRAFDAHRAGAQAGAAGRVRAARAGGPAGYTSARVIAVGVRAQRHYGHITVVRAARRRRRDGGRDEDDEAANAEWPLHDLPRAATVVPGAGARRARSRRGGARGSPAIQ